MLYQAAFNNQSYCSDDQGYVDGWDNDSMAFAYAQNGSGGPPVPPQHINPGQPDPPPGNCGLVFGSIHATCHFVFCDGSVHSVEYSVSPTTWVRLCSINDGQPVGTDGWE
jgi:hypothetical protein